MVETTLHPTPRWRDVLLEQIRVLGFALRWETLAFAAFLGIGTFVILADIPGGRSGFDSTETFHTPLVAFLFPFAVWKGEARFGAAFLWTLPVERRRLALAKVFAGWVWLMAALLIVVLWMLSLGQIVVRIPWTSTVAAYLLGSALVVGFRQPIRWLIGGAGVLFLLGQLSEAFDSGPSALDIFMDNSGLMDVIDNAAATWGASPALARWAITTFLSLGPGLVALWAAASRHKETRKQVPLRYRPTVRR